MNGEAGRCGNRQRASHVVYYASPPQKCLPGSDGAGNIYDCIDVILDAAFPRLLPGCGGGGTRQRRSHGVYYVSPPEKCLPGSNYGGNIHGSLDVILDATFPKLLPENGGRGTRQTVWCVVYYGSSERDLSGSGKWGIRETPPMLS
jgi:hypothetical protein